MKKFLALVLCLCTLLGATACKSTPADPYADILEAYTSLLQRKLDGDELPTYEDASASTEALLTAIVAHCEDPYELGYAKKDLNGDGDEELILMRQRYSRIFAVYTLKDGKAALVDSYAGTDEAGTICEDGRLLKHGAPEDHSRGSYYRFTEILENGETEILEYGSYSDASEEELREGTSELRYYKVEDGKREAITKTAFNRFFQLEVDPIWINSVAITNAHALRFVPALPGSRIADFSTYDNILKLYKRIVEEAPDYTKDKWLQGKYDSMYEFPDNESYELFFHLFQATVPHCPKTESYNYYMQKEQKNAFGYAKKDLNGDGTEELILMTDSWDVLAVFTEKDGKAVFLESEVWIDAEGLLHASVWTRGMTDRDMEYYLYEITDGALQAKAAIGVEYNFYLQPEKNYRIENGKQIEISQEEWDALYAQCDIIPNGCSEAEYMRTNANLTFQPLFDRSDPFEYMYHNKTWVRYGNYYLYPDRLRIVDMYREKVRGIFSYTKEVVNGEEIRAGGRIEAAPVDGKMAFEAPNFRGYLEFGVNCVWMIVEESNDENVECRAYLFDRLAED